MKRHNAKEKHLTMRRFSYLNTTTRHSSTRHMMTRDVQRKTQIRTTPWSVQSNPTAKAVSKIMR